MTKLESCDSVSGKGDSELIERPFPLTLTLSPEGRGNRPSQSQDHRHTQHEVTSAAAPGFHAALAKQRGVLRRYCESLEGLRDVLLLRNGHDTEREQHVVLQLAWQWADVVGAGYKQQDIDLLDTDLDFATGDRLGNRASVDELCAGLEFSRDAEFLHHLGGNVAGAAVRIPDRLGIEPCPLERFDAADVGLRCAGLHRDSDAGLAEIHVRSGYDFALGDEVVDGLPSGGA